VTRRVTSIDDAARQRQRTPARNALQLLGQSGRAKRFKDSPTSFSDGGLGVTAHLLFKTPPTAGKKGRGPVSSFEPAPCDAQRAAEDELALNEAGWDR
jgi:hypothetical protein